MHEKQAASVLEENLYQCPNRIYNLLLIAPSSAKSNERYGIPRSQTVRHSLGSMREIYPY